MTVKVKFFEENARAQAAGKWWQVLATVFAILRLKIDSICFYRGRQIRQKTNWFSQRKY